jgi:hypothetical protein
VHGGGDDHRRRWRLNWDRLALVAFVALQVTLVVVLLAALVAIATR